MSEVELKDLVGGALQEQFSKSFKKVIENLQHPDTPYKNNREITIKLKFSQNEKRDNVSCDISVTEKLAPQAPMITAFAVGKDLESGEVFVEEYGKQIKGQMRLDDYATEQVVDGKTVDTDTGEIIDNGQVLDFRKAATV